MKRNRFNQMEFIAVKEQWSALSEEDRKRPTGDALLMLKAMRRKQKKSIQGLKIGDRVLQMLFERKKGQKPIQTGKREGVRNAHCAAMERLEARRVRRREADGRARRLRWATGKSIRGQREAKG